MASMLLMVLSFVLVMGVFLVYLVLRWRYLRDAHSAPVKATAES